MAQGETITKEQDAINMSDKTGLFDTFSYQHMEEMRTLFPEVPDPEQVRDVITQEDIEERRRQRIGFFASDEQRDKGLFEKLFGYNATGDTPLDYQKMSGFERAVMRAELNAQNITTRAGIGAIQQTKGTLQLFMPKSMEEFFELHKFGTEASLEEDVYYERGQQRDLLDKQESVGLSEEEDAQLQYLNETLPSGIQKAPEFVGRVAAEVERMALASEIFSLIPLPGFGTLSDGLSALGKKLLGGRLMLKAGELASKPVRQAALKSLSNQITQLGPNIGQLFTWGFIAAETEEDEGAGRRAIEGSKMTAWAAVPVVGAPTLKGLQATKAGQFTIQLVQSAMSKVASPIADKLAKMQASKAKKVLVNQGMVEADEIFKAENGRLMNASEKKVVKNALVELADKTAKVAQQDSDDIIKQIETWAAAELSKDPVGAETIVPKALRSVDTVGDDIVNSTIAHIEKTTKYTAVKQPNGNYAVLNTENMHEVAVNVKRKELSKKMTEVIFGDKSKSPIKNKTLVPRTQQTKITVNQEAQLRRGLKAMEKATNQAYRAGVKDANEKAAVKLLNAKERIQTIQAGNQEGWKNVEFARELVKDFVPKAEQGKFMARIIKARTQGGLDKIMDDINAHVDKARVRNTVDSLRSSVKAAAKKFGNKDGRFAKAPDEIRPILEQIDKSVEGINKLTQRAGADIDDLGQLADDMIAGINASIAGKGEVLGLPAGLADDLYNIKIASGQKLSADDIESIANLTKIVLHRSEQAHLITIGGELKASSEAISDSLGRVVPRKLKPIKQTLGAKFQKLYKEDSDHPITLIEKMFGQNSNMGTLLDDLYEGEVKAFGVMRQSYGIVKDYMAKNNINDDVFNGLKKKLNVNINGKSITITRDDALGLAMSSRDPWVFEQMLKTEGYHIGGIDIGRASTDEIADIIAKLTPEEMRLGGAMFHLNGNYLSQVINETSLHLNGVKLATHPQYYPSHRSLNKTLYGNKWAHQTAETQSNFMPRVGGSRRMRINPFSRELMDSIQNSAMYNGTSSPMRSLKTVLSDSGLQNHLKNNGYKGEMSNLIDILSRSEGLYSDSSVIDSIGSDILNRFTKGILGGRVSTIGTQAASIPAAKSVIPGKYFVGVNPAKMSQSVDDLMTSDFFWYRWTGRRVSVELGDTASKSSLSHFIFDKTPITEKPLTGLVWGDKAAISTIYQAARKQLAAEAKLSGDDLTRAAIKLTEKATRETQPNWSVLTRSKLASDPGVFKRSMTMFRTAQEAQFNIWKRANIRYAQSGKTTADLKALKNSYQAVLESQMAVALWKTIWKRGREAGVAGVAGWLGVYTPEDKDPFAEDLVKSSARTVAGTVPLGQLMETAVEKAYDQLMGEGAHINTSEDPISTVTQAAFAATHSIAKWTNKYIESNTKRTGYTADFMPATLDDLLDEISTSEADREQKKQELINQVTKDVVKAVRAASLVSGLPVGPLDEWVAPGLKRSEFALVNRVNGNNASDPAGLARNLDKFLTKQQELKKKEESKGLTEDEAALALNMNIIKKSIIDPVFAVDDAVGNKGEGVLDSMQETLDNFVKDNL